MITLQKRLEEKDGKIVEVDEEYGGIVLESRNKEEEEKLRQLTNKVRLYFYNVHQLGVFVDRTGAVNIYPRKHSLNIGVEILQNNERFASNEYYELVLQHIPFSLNGTHNPIRFILRPNKKGEIPPFSILYIHYENLGRENRLLATRIDDFEKRVGYLPILKSKRLDD